MNVRFSKNRQYFTIYCLLSIGRLLAFLLHASLVNPKYFNLVSHFYYENPFNITVARFLRPL